MHTRLTLYICTTFLQNVYSLSFKNGKYGSLKGYDTYDNDENLNSFKVS